MALGLVAYLLLQYGSALRIPFMNDDYLFLTRVWGASPETLLAPNSLVSGYYRPWSRELHYWALQALFGSNAVTFHVVNLLLWLATMWTFFLIASATAGVGFAVTATAGAALVAAWATPILWAAGSQDLWMTATGLGFLRSSMRGRRVLASLLLAISLLSKETAAIFAGIATAHLLIVDRRGIGEVLKRVWPYWLMVGLWAALHPMLGGSWANPSSSEAASAGSSLASRIVRSLLAIVNLDARPAPERGAGSVLLTALPGVLVLAGLTWWALSRRPGPVSFAAEPAGEARVRAARAAAWGVLWWALGWLPSLWFGIGFQPYYGLVGLLGGWLAIGAVIGRRRGLAVVLIVVVALSRSAYAQTPQASLGSEWHQRRLASLTRQMRGDIRRLRPALPPHSRVYFGDVPWGIGLIASHPQSPALRVWYANSTLTGGFYSRYRPRGAMEPRGRDFFFLFDRATGHLVEVTRGPEPLEAGHAPTPRWEWDHFYLARQLLRSGDPASSAEEWRKLVTVFPKRQDYARELAAALQAAGETDSAAVW